MFLRSCNCGIEEKSIAEQVLGPGASGSDGATVERARYK